MIGSAAGENAIGDPVPVTAICTSAVAPGDTEKELAPVEAMLNDWLVVVTARLTVVLVFGELVGVMVMVCVPVGVVASVEMVTVTGGALVPLK